MPAVLSQPKSTVRVIGTNGQISLGKAYAGRQVLIEEREPGVWLVRTALVIPDDERWLHTSAAQADLSEGLRHLQATSPLETDLQAFSSRFL